MNNILKNLEILTIANKYDIQLEQISYLNRTSINLIDINPILKNLSDEHLNNIFSSTLLKENIHKLNNISKDSLKFLFKKYSKLIFEKESTFLKLLSLKNIKKYMLIFQECDYFFNDNLFEILYKIFIYSENKNIILNKDNLYFSINFFNNIKEYDLDENLKLKYSLSSFLTKINNINIFKNEDFFNINIEIIDDFSKYINKGNYEIFFNFYLLYFNQKYHWNYLLNELSNLNKIELEKFNELLKKENEKSSYITHKEIISILNISKGKEKTSIDDILELLYIKNFQKYQIDFIKRNIHKKNFINIIKENLDKYLLLEKNNILFKPEFYTLINLNSLNSKNLNILINTKNKNSKYYLSPNNIYNFKIIKNIKNITFNELITLLHQSEILIYLYKEFINLNIKIDQRLLIVKQLPNIQINFFHKYNIQNNNFFYKNLANKLINNSFIKFKEKLLKDYNNLKRLNSKCIFIIYYFYKIYEPFLNEIQKDLDLDLIFENKDYLKEKKISLFKFKLNNLKYNTNYTFLINSLKLSPEFINKNILHILDFFDKKLDIVYFEFMNNKNQDSLQKNNMKLLVKAELSNKLNEIKFQDKDFDLEIGLKIEKNIKNEWKNNIISKTNNMIFEETYDFNDIIRLGEIPIATCQHWKNGSYSKSLLSNFDTNKKMIKCSFNNKIVARALLRLTKETNNQNIINNTYNLTFKDISEVQIQKQTTKDTKENLVLFLEKTYSNLDKKNLFLAKEEIIKLAINKAKKLNAILLVSLEYKDIIRNIQPKYFNVFISYSKNGSQYLDSLGGINTHSSEGKYIKTKLFNIKEVI